MTVAEYKYNVTPADCEFVINEEKRTVVCYLEGTKDIFVDFIEHNSQLPPYIFSNDFFLKLRMPDRFVGVAKCSEEDTFDIEIGQMVAFSRLKDKVNKSFFRRANTYIRTLDKWMDEAVENINRVGEKLERNQEHRHDFIANKIAENVGEKND